MTLTEGSARSAPGPLDGLQTALDEYVPRLLRRTQTPGLSLAVNLDGDQVACAYGYADRATRTPLTPDHTMRFGSVSKTIIAIAVMQEVEAGRLALDQPLADVVGDHLGDTLPPDVTLRHLLSHRSGLRTDLPYSCLELPTETTTADALRTLLDRGAAWEYPAGERRPLRIGPPGEQFVYSNLGMGLAAFAVEVTSGLPYGEVVQRRVFDRAGMSLSHMPDIGKPLPADVAASLSTGYMQWADRAIPTPEMHLRIPSVAGLVSTPCDYLRLVQALLQDGLLLRRSSVETMFTRHAQAASPGAPLQSVALGFHWLDDDSPRRWVGHAGAYSFGWAADARYYPHSGLTLCAAQNAVDITRYVQPPDRSAYGLLASFVASWCHDRPAVKPAREPSWERGYVAGLRVADRVTGLAGAGSLGDDAVARMISGTQPPDPQWADGFRAAIEATREIAADPAATERFLAHEAAVPAAFMELEMLAAGGSRATFGPQLYFTR